MINWCHSHHCFICESWKNKFLKNQVHFLLWCQLPQQKPRNCSLMGNLRNEIQMLKTSLPPYPCLGLGSFLWQITRCVCCCPARQAWALVGVIDGGSSSCNESVRNYENHSTGGKALAQGEFYTLDGQKFSVTAYSEWIEGRQRWFKRCETWVRTVTDDCRTRLCVSLGRFDS